MQIQLLNKVRDMMRNTSATVAQAKSESPVEGEQLMIHDAVIGFVDIVSSCRITNSADLQTGWELKMRFMKLAMDLAGKYGMKVLNHTGDGFVFLANGDGRKNWGPELLAFHGGLIEGFASILADLKGRIGSVESGIRVGVACGDMILGNLGPYGIRDAAVGPEVNLAARLCAQARVNELVVSSRVWFQMGAALEGREAQRCVHSDLKGFDGFIPAFHIAPFAPRSLSTPEWVAPATELAAAA